MVITASSGTGCCGSTSLPGQIRSPLPDPEGLRRALTLRFLTQLRRQSGWSLCATNRKSVLTATRRE